MFVARMNVIIIFCVITNCASFAVFHLCPGFVPEAKSAFSAFFFPPLLLWKAGWYPDSRSGSFHLRDPSSEDTLGPPRSIRPVTLPLPLKRPHNITLSRDFRLESGADLVASWIISITDDVNEKRDKGPRVNKDKCNYISRARTNTQNGCIWVLGRCTFVAVRHSRIE